MEDVCGNIDVPNEVAVANNDLIENLLFNMEVPDENVLIGRTLFIGKGVF